MIRFPCRGLKARPAGEFEAHVTVEAQGVAAFGRARERGRSSLRQAAAPLLVDVPLDLTFLPGGVAAAERALKVLDLMGNAGLRAREGQCPQRPGARAVGKRASSHLLVHGLDVTLKVRN